MPTLTKNPYFSEDVGRKVHNLHTDTLKFMLTNTDPSAARYKSEVVEIAAGNGYVAGGFAVPGNTYAGSPIAKLNATSDPGFTASGPVGPFRWAVLYNDTAANDEVIGVLDRGTPLTLAINESYSIDVNAVNGILQAT